MHSYLRLGDHNVVDDRTGFNRKASQTRMQWNNIRTHWSSWESRQPQDFVPSVVDKQIVSNPRPVDEDEFLTANQVKASDL